MDANEPQSRFEKVSRRALLKATTGLGIAALLPAACGTNDDEFLEGALTELVTGESLAVPTTAPMTVPTSTPVELATDDTPTGDDGQSSTAEQPSAEQPTAEPTVEPTAAPAQEPTAEPTAEPTPVPATSSVAGSLITTFTYTQGAGGKNENPYVAVWIEDTSGELVQTIALFYDRNHRKGASWLDHLLQWWDTDQARIRAGGQNTVTTISSATRFPGEYAVQWDGTAGGTTTPAGNYVLCIEAAREEGPYSFISETLTLNAQAAFYQLGDDGELSSASVQTGT